MTPPAPTLGAFPGLPHAHITELAEDGEACALLVPREVYVMGTTVFDDDGDYPVITAGGGYWCRSLRETPPGWVALVRVEPLMVPRREWRSYVPRRPHGKALRVAIDFDSVVHADPGHFTICEEVAGGPNPGAIEWLTQLLSDPDVRGVINTCRFTHGDPLCPEYKSSPPEVVERGLKTWLAKHGLPEECIERLSFWAGVGKPTADIYIDDKAFAFVGVFPSVEEMRATMKANKALRQSRGCR